MVDSTEELEQPRRAVPIAPLGIPPNVGVVRATTLPGEFPKGKRRGVPGSTSGVTNGEADASMTPEERMKQKRMLRNRESAARSRDKRRNRNAAMQQDIEVRRAKISSIDAMCNELQAIIDAARITGSNPINDAPTSDPDAPLTVAEVSPPEPAAPTQ